MCNNYFYIKIEKVNSSKRDGALFVNIISEVLKNNERLEQVRES